MTQLLETISAEIDSFTNLENPIFKIEEEFDIRDYQRRIENLANSRSPFIFYYAGIAQASIVLSNIIKNSNSVIRMVCGSLNSKLKSESSFLNSIEDFLLRGGELRILLDDHYPDVESEFTNLLNIYKDLNNVQIRAFKDGAGIFDEDYNLIHYMTGDDSIYRREFDCVQFLARGSFNDPDETEELNKFFDDAFESESISYKVSNLK